MLTRKTFKRGISKERWRVAKVLWQKYSSVKSACSSDNYIQGNQMSFMTKQPSKEIMKRSRLRNNFPRNITQGNKILTE